MISENSLELLEYPKLLRTISDQAHCPATQKAILDIRPYRNLPDIIQRQRLVEELRRISAEGCPLQIFSFADLKPFLEKARPIGAVLDPLELSAFIPLLQLSSAIAGQIREAEEIPQLKNMTRNLKGFPELLAFLERALDQEGNILDQASPLLAELRREIRQLEAQIRRKLEEGLYYLGMIQPLPAAVFTPIPDQNWMEAWKERYHPIPIGKRLIIVPAWLESPEAARVSIKIDPGMAFGTGTHPSTQLCLELIEQFCDQEPGATLPSMTAIDVGCGSGILSIGALKLGMGTALGVDIDEASVRASRENSDTNAIAPERFEIGLGSVTEILEGRFPVREASLVLANILTPIIIRLFGMGLADLVERGGALILSGILAEQVVQVQTCAEKHGMKFVKKSQMGDWVALLFTR